MTSSLGDITATTHVTIAVTGLAGTGHISQLLVWSEVIPGQDAEWAVIDDSQTPNWSATDDDQDADWQEVA